MIEDPPPLTAQEERKWRAEFKRLGVHDVREQLRFGGLAPESKRDLARRWLRERENAADWYVRWTFRAAVVAAVVALIGVYLSWRAAP